MNPQTPDRTRAPRIVDAVEFDLKLPACERFVLDNGIPVYLLRAEEQDTLQLDLVFRAGSWLESQPAQAEAASALIKNGSQRHSALELSETIDYYGAFLNQRCSYENASVTLHCLSRHFQQLLPTIREVLTEAAYPQEELEIYARNMQQRLEVNLKKCEFVANRRIDQCLFGATHPYGRVHQIADFAVLNVEQLRSFYRRYYTSGNCVIFLAGKLPEQGMKWLNDTLGKDAWNGSDAALIEELPMEADREHKHRIQNDPQGVQGAIRIARTLPNRYHPDFQKLEVLNTILGGYFGSRLMSNLREDKGFTYGIYSGLYPYRQKGALNIHAEVGKDACESAVQEIYRELELLRTKPVDTEELSLVRNYMMGSLLGDLDGSFQVIRRWKSLLLAGLDESHFYRQVDLIKNLDEQQLQNLAQQYLNPEDFYEVVVV